MYGVWCIPPKKGLMSGLKPRFQIQNGKIFEYMNQKEAQDQADLCNSEPIKEKIMHGNILLKKLIKFYQYLNI